MPSEKKTNSTKKHGGKPKGPSKKEADPAIKRKSDAVISFEEERPSSKFRQSLPVPGKRKHREEQPDNKSNKESNTNRKINMKEYAFMNDMLRMKHNHQRLREAEARAASMIEKVIHDVVEEEVKRKDKRELMEKIINRAMELSEETKTMEECIQLAIGRIAWETETSNSDILKKIGKDANQQLKELLSKTYQELYAGRTAPLLQEALLEVNESMAEDEMRKEKEEKEKFAKDAEDILIEREIKKKEEEETNNMEDFVPKDPRVIQEEAWATAPEIDEDMFNIENLMDTFDKETEDRWRSIKVRFIRGMKEYIKTMKNMSNQEVLKTLQQLESINVSANSKAEDLLDKLGFYEDNVELLSPSQVMEYIIKLRDLIKADATHPDDIEENNKLTEFIGTMWRNAVKYHPSYFHQYVESEGDFVSRMDKLIQKREKLVPTNTNDITPERKKLLEELEAEIVRDYNTYVAVKNSITDISAIESGTNIRNSATSPEYINDEVAGTDLMAMREQAYWDNVKELTNIRKQLATEIKKANPNYNKIQELKKLWDEVNDKAEVKDYNEDKEAYAIQTRKFLTDFRENVSQEADEAFIELANKMFPEYKEGEIYYIYEDFPELFDLYYKIRAEVDDEKMLNKAFLTGDWDWWNSIKAEINYLMQRLDTFKKPTRDPQTIVSDIKMREKLLSNVVSKFQHTGKVEDAMMYKPNKHEIAVYNNLQDNHKTVTAEFTAKEIYKVLSKNFPQNWTDATLRLEQDVMDLRTAVKDDISSFGPFLSTVVNEIWDKFRSKVQSVNEQQRMSFDASVESEKKYLQKVISKEAYARTGATMYEAAKATTLQKFVMDPTSFNAKDAETMMTHTPLGMYLSDTRRLLDLVRQSMDLRKKMVGDVMRTMNMEGNPDSLKFDVVVSNLFPPAQVDLKMRYLMSMDPKARKKYENGRFIQAIKLLDPDFDFDTLTNENFLEKVNSIGQSAKSFLQTIVTPTPVAWGDFEVMSNELIRTQYAILSQVRDKPVENDIDRQDDGGQGPTDDFQYDQDAGAVMNENGFRVNSTFNPATQGQIIRDKIDEEKRSSYMQMVGSLATQFMEPSQDEPYVPMHTGSAKFFFSGGNYKNLKSQYQSMRPLIPKNPVDDPNGFIEETLAYYGPVLGIKKRKSSQKDHPAFLQKEAIELQELVAAYNNYTTDTGGNYVHDGQAMNNVPVQQQVQAPPDNTPDDNSSAPLKNVDPNSTGENVSDPMMSGLNSVFNNTSDMDTGYDIFSNYYKK